jgi:hypothetical protein
MINLVQIARSMQDKAQQRLFLETDALIEEMRHTAPRGLGSLQKSFRTQIDTSGRGIRIGVVSTKPHSWRQDRFLLCHVPKGRLGEASFQDYGRQRKMKWRLKRPPQQSKQQLEYQRGYRAMVRNEVPAQKYRTQFTHRALERRGGQKGITQRIAAAMQ